MFCKNCGAEIDEKAFCCPKCGVLTNNDVQRSSVSVQTKPDAPSGGFAVLSFFIPLVGLIFMANMEKRNAAKSKIVRTRRADRCNSERCVIRNRRRNHDSDCGDAFLNRVFKVKKNFVSRKSLREGAFFIASVFRRISEINFYFAKKLRNNRSRQSADFLVKKKNGKRFSSQKYLFLAKI